MGELNVRRLSELVWGFLNSCLTGKAREEFDGADILDGVDGWRLVIQHIFQGAQTRKGLLRKSVKNPPAISKLEDVPSGITRFASIMKAYTGAGGSPPEGHELKIARSGVYGAIGVRTEEAAAETPHRQADQGAATSGARRGREQ